MARPKRGNYATGEAGLARYKEALRKYLAKTKKTTKPEVKKPAPKKPVAKKPVAKKPATKRPGMTKAEKQEMLKGNSIQDKEKALKKTASKKPVAKKPPVKKPVAKKPVAKKPATTTKPKRTANQLKIKKAATNAQKAIKKATPVVKKAAKTIAKKAGEAKKTVTKKASQLRQAIKKGKAPTPKTPQQKAVSKVYRGAKSYGKKVLKKGGKDLLKIGKGILKNPKSAAKGVLGGIATATAGKIINRRVDSVFAKRKGMSVDEYRAARSKALKAKKPTTKKVTKTEKPTVTKKTTTPKPTNKLKTWKNPVGAKGKGKPSSVKTEKKDPLAAYRRGEGTKLGKDTRITKKLKKAGFTEDRLARLRMKHDEWKKRRKKKK